MNLRSRISLTLTEATMTIAPSSEKNKVSRGDQLKVNVPDCGTAIQYSCVKARGIRQTPTELHLQSVPFPPSSGRPRRGEILHARPDRSSKEIQTRPDATKHHSVFISPWRDKFVMRVHDNPTFPKPDRKPQRFSSTDPSPVLCAIFPKSTAT